MLCNPFEFCINFYLSQTFLFIACIREKDSDNLQKELVELCLFYILKSPLVPERYISELWEAAERALEIIEEFNIFQVGLIRHLSFVRTPDTCKEMDVNL